MDFELGRDVRFLLLGDELIVRREERRWELRWRGRHVHAEHIDRAVAELLGQPGSIVLPLVTRLLRAEPGTELEAEA